MSSFQFHCSIQKSFLSPCPRPRVDDIVLLSCCPPLFAYIADFNALKRDLKSLLPDATGLSERNLYYTKKFYNLYSQVLGNLQQVVADSENQISQQVAAKLFSVPWGHHMLLIDKVKDDYETKATVQCSNVQKVFSIGINNRS